LEILEKRFLVAFVVLAYKQRSVKAEIAQMYEIELTHVSVSTAWRLSLFLFNVKGGTRHTLAAEN